MYQDYIGKPRNSLRTEKLIAELCCENPRFLRWFEDKFLKWEYDLVDQDCAEVLADSVTKALLEREY